MNPLNGFSKRVVVSGGQQNPANCSRRGRLIHPLALCLDQSPIECRLTTVWRSGRYHRRPSSGYCGECCHGYTISPGQNWRTVSRESTARVYWISSSSPALKPTRPKRTCSQKGSALARPLVAQLHLIAPQVFALRTVSRTVARPGLRNCNGSRPRWQSQRQRVNARHRRQ